MPVCRWSRFAVVLDAGRSAADLQHEPAIRFTKLAFQTQFVCSGRECGYYAHSLPCLFRCKQCRFVHMCIKTVAAVCVLCNFECMCIPITRNFHVCDCRKWIVVVSFTLSYFIKFKLNAKLDCVFAHTPIREVFHDLWIIVFTVYSTTCRQQKCTEQDFLYSPRCSYWRYVFWRSSLCLGILRTAGPCTKNSRAARAPETITSDTIEVGYPNTRVINRVGQIAGYY